MGDTDPFDTSFLRYVISSALISFDTGRMMRTGLDVKYEIEAGGFAWRLNSKLQGIRPLLNPHRVERNRISSTPDEGNRQGGVGANRSCDSRH